MKMHLLVLVIIYLQLLVFVREVWAISVLFLDQFGNVWLFIYVTVISIFVIFCFCE